MAPVTAAARPAVEAQRIADTAWRDLPISHQKAVLYIIGVIRAMSAMNAAPGPVQWRKARGSMGNGNCVEISPVTGGVVVRDSKNPVGPVLRYSATSWLAFTREAQLGRFDWRDA